MRDPSSDARRAGHDAVTAQLSLSTRIAADPTRAHVRRWRSLCCDGSVTGVVVVIWISGRIVSSWVVAMRAPRKVVWLRHARRPVHALPSRIVPR